MAKPNISHIEARYRLEEEIIDLFCKENKGGKQCPTKRDSQGTKPERDTRKEVNNAS